MKNPITATLQGLWEMRAAGSEIPPLRDDERLDGRTAVVTGANRGLGRAIAIELARRGARVVLACRSGLDDAIADVRRASGSEHVEARRIDLADLRVVERFVGELRDDGVRIDVLVLNAGVVPRDARPTEQGLELMFGVNFLANVALVEQLLEAGIVVPSEADPPRIVFVTSESHRGAGPVDFARLGHFVPFGAMSGMKVYGYSKLLLSVYASQLARRLGSAASVHACCPGPVNSDIAREAPAWTAPVLRAVMNRWFRSPEDAARPLVYLACAERLRHSTGTYLHVLVEKPPDDECLREDVGARLVDECTTILRRVREQQA